MLSAAVVDNDGFLVRRMRSEDVAAVQELHAALLPVGYPYSFFLHLLIQSERLCLVAYDTPPCEALRTKSTLHSPVASRRLVGFISAAVCRPAAIPVSSPSCSIRHVDPPRIEILTLGVAESHRRQGLARRLVQEVIDMLYARVLPRPENNRGERKQRKGVCKNRAEVQGSGIENRGNSNRIEAGDVSAANHKGHLNIIVQAHVSVNNTAARNFYRKIGLIACQEVPGYYQTTRGMGSNSALLVAGKLGDVVAAFDAPLFERGISRSGNDPD
ncbi:acyl-CoA N-acyltransferase [Fistulina hepatica ATCC 64428]|uniref:N-alpha-acetyltransferase 60 n=1 Tax=Fistulina hepatica ATCC 64428 TaxID=1128425 RepID=A0A0D7ANA7_9AGAR|nr:acyl-CoA N-acyltransferase [Fistulina hepatica ATCC 64428]